MTRIAVYTSVLYGEDFVIESIQSIRPYVDAVYVVMMQRPWGNTEGVNYRGQWVPWPEVFDHTRERIASLMDAGVTIIETQKDTPWNRWGYAVNDVIRGQLGIFPDEVVLIDPDCVFADDQAEKAFSDWTNNPEYRWAHVDQVELWRTPAWQVTRPRSMVSMHRGDLSLLSTTDAKKRPSSFRLPGRVHNLGFCVSEQTMRWKHLASLAFSPVVGESLPNPDWLEQKWVKWHPMINNRNLEVSIGCESGIEKAVPYDVSQLPASIKRRYDAGEWPTW